MEDLLKRLQSAHNLSATQSQEVLQTIVNYIKEKFPMVEGAIDSMFRNASSGQDTGTTPSDFQSVTKSTPPGHEDILE